MLIIQDQEIIFSKNRVSGSFSKSWPGQKKLGCIKKNLTRIRQVKIPNTNKGRQLRNN